jgi:hypothetical protein
VAEESSLIGFDEEKLRAEVDARVARLRAARDGSLPTLDLT